MSEKIGQLKLQMRKEDKITKVAIFEGRKIRRHWDEQNEKWWFAVVDVVAALSESTNPQVYWRVLKKRLLDEGANETVTKCNALKMLATDNNLQFSFFNFQSIYI